jgi:hypothetical protein
MMADLASRQSIRPVTLLRLQNGKWSKFCRLFFAASFLSLEGHSSGRIFSLADYNVWSIRPQNSHPSPEEIAKVVKLGLPG